jgi:hypothetical protein
MITITDLASILEQLALERPIFHSEADFQHALAWLIHERYSDCRVRLEVNPYTDGQRAYIDILLSYQGTPIALELKYKTRKLDIDHNYESFHLLNQSAQDAGRYDFIKDISRLERFVVVNPQSLGYAIFLSNDSSYWRAMQESSNAVDKQFRIHEQATLRGNLTWGELAGEGTRRGREKIIELQREYPLQWHEYSTLNESTVGQFRYLLLAAHNEAIT